MVKMENSNFATYMGYAEADITPETSMELIGFERPNNMSKGILHKLLAQVLVCKTPNEICCLITIDSLGFTVELTNTLRDLVANKINTTREKVMVCFSHTHSAPNAQNEEYYNFICEQILKAIDTATKDLSSVNAAWGIAKNNIGINRRGNNESIDDRLGLLKITYPTNDKIKLLLVRVTAHGNVLSSDNHLISSDYFGAARNLLKEKYNCHIMMIQGAAGNIRPKYQQENAEYLEIHSFKAAQKEYTKSEKEKYFKQSLKALENMAAEIYKSVNCIINDLMPRPINRISIFSTASRFFVDVPTTSRAHMIAEEANEKAGIDGTDWLLEVERLRNKHIKQQYSDIEIQYFILNEGCFCGIPNEVMCEISLDIMKKAGDELLFFNGYTNACNSYLPTAAEYDKGGYEVLWSNLIYYKYHGRIMPFNRDTAEQLIKDVSQNWQHYKKRP